MNFVKVILPLALSQYLTYSVPSEFVSRIKIGMRVIVQLGVKKLYSGIVVELTDEEPIDFKVKPIISILDTEPLIDTKQLKFWEWIASYYMCTQGEVMKAALPAGLKLESETKISSVNEDVSLDELSDIDRIIVLEVQKKKQTVEELSNIVGRKNILSNLKGLYEQGIVSFDEALRNNYKAKFEKFIVLHPDIQSENSLNYVLSDLSSSPKQRQLLMTYIEEASPLNYASPLEIGQKDLLQKAGVSASVLKACIEKNILYLKEMQIDRLSDDIFASKQLPVLSDAQQKAYHAILDNFVKQNTVLLHGVTSSGKTEVYIRLIHEYLNKGCQVLYLLPEIALTVQIIQRLQVVFGNKIGVYHSRFSDAERVEIYNKLLNRRNTEDNGYVILGVRSSVFLPFHNLGLIIVDEEHETTYKQYDPAPRYHARDSAMVLASLHGAKVLLGSATPSIESYNNARREKYGLVELTERYGDAVLPFIDVVDMIKARKKKLVTSHFSNELLDAIEQCIANKEQVILFQNRRGYSSYLQCKSCGYVPHCEHCAVSLTYHKYNNQLNCHYCGFTIAVPSLCPKCSSLDISTCGFGTEKIEDELNIILPHARVERLDLDSTKTKNAYERILTKFTNGDLDILVGTQMVTKGLHFDNVSLVGILNADNMLNFPDFRAYERSFQLMSQVAGRAGRKGKQGRVIIQTSVPDNPVIQKVINHQYFDFYMDEVDDRRLFFYPPYSRLVILTLKHNKQDVVNEAARRLAHLLQAVFGTQLAGPEAPSVNRIQNRYLLNFRIKLKRDTNLPKYKQLMNECFANLQASDKLFASLQLSVDVDP